MGLLSKVFGRDREPTRDVAALVAGHQRPAVRLTVEEAPTGSWFGGSPAVPPGFLWPRKDGRPLTFLLQLDLQDIAATAALDWLPKEGSLLFFYDLVGFPWGFDPADRGGWAVHFTPPATPRCKRPPPPDAEPAHRLEQHALGTRRVDLPPATGRAGIEMLELTDRELDQLGSLHDSRFEDRPQHHVGGFPGPIQGDEMELDCQLASHGLFCGDASGYSDPRAAELEPGAADWRLLLQLDSDEDLGVMWGDLGRLYFWVREEEARLADFSGTWLILQCG